MAANRQFASGETVAGAIERARRQLRWILILFSVALVVPLALLARHVLATLAADTLHRYQSEAREVSYSIESQLTEFLRIEERRPSSDYSFYRVGSNDLLPVQQVEISPLSVLPEYAATPGLLGYFQINSDGTVHSPLLPETNISADPIQGTLIEAQEFDRRVDALNRLRAALPAEFAELPAGHEQSANRIENVLQLPAAELNSAIGPDKVQLKNSTGSGKVWTNSARTFSAKVPELRSESVEVSPFQLAIASPRELILYRAVRLSQREVRQGLVLDSRAFIDSLVQQALKEHPAAAPFRIEVQRVYGAKVEPIFSKGPEFGVEKATLYDATLPSPFESLHIRLATGQLPLAAGAREVNSLLAVLAVVLVVGLAFIYWLAGQQLEVAQERSNFVSAVSHELRTPLTSIRMYGDMLRAGFVADETRRRTYYDFICSEGERLSRLIDSILYFARLGRERPFLALENLPADELLSTVASRVESQVHGAGFSMEVTSDEVLKEENITVLVDKDAFTQVMLNLVENALKFAAGAEKKHIEMRCFLRVGRRSELVFSVRDFGPGVARKDMRRIFELFFRPGDELTRRTPGTGIGLALVQDLAARMGAEVEVANCDPGAEFKVVFKESAGANNNGK